MKKPKLKPFKVNVTIEVHEKNWIAAWDFVERKLGGEIVWVEESNPEKDETIKRWK